MYGNHLVTQASVTAKIVNHDDDTSLDFFTNTTIKLHFFYFFIRTIDKNTKLIFAQNLKTISKRCQLQNEKKKLRKRSSTTHLQVR